MTKPPVFSVDQALRRLAGEARTLTTASHLQPIENATGRVLAESVCALVDSPPADSSAMDGFAVCYQDVDIDRPLKVSQRIAAGDDPKALIKGTAARIFTGAVMPRGTDTVVIQENCTYDDNRVRIRSGFQEGAHVRRRGGDIRCGDKVLEQGHRLRPQDIGLVISAGVAKVSVWEPLSVAVIATGSELTDIRQPRKPGGIYESNSPMLSALLKQMGCQVMRYNIDDDLEGTKRMLTKALANHHMAITIGGVSVGDEDHVKVALSSLGEIEFWKINMKPGKPFLFAHVDGKPVMGLPGNPVSAFVTFNLFCRPFIRRSFGASFDGVKHWSAIAAFDRQKLSDRQDYLRGQSVWENDQRLVKPVGSQLSSMQGTLCAADVLIVVPPNSTVHKGQAIDVISIDEWT